MDDVIDLDAKRRERPSEVKIVLGGETFRARTTVRPEETLEWDDFYEGDDTSVRHQIEVADLTILRFLVAEDHEKWKKLRARTVGDIIGNADLVAFVQALQEAAADRPTVPSGTSSPGTGNGAAASTAESSSPVATPPA